MPNPLIRIVAIALMLVATAAAAREPVIDVHVHALAADEQGPPPLGMCTPFAPHPLWDQRHPYADDFFAAFKKPRCKDPVWSPTTDDALMRETLAELRRNNVYAVLSGDLERVRRWRAQAPDRVIPALGFQLDDHAPTVDAVRAAMTSGDVQVFGEIGNQYLGILPDDPRMEPYWALAESLDIPVAIHIGTGPPGVHYMGADGYRASMHSALTLEPVLVRHPKLRVYVMHAGYPMLDDMLAVLYAHPQVYVDTGVIVYTEQRAAFYRYLKALVDGGFGQRILFGSDQMVWPGVIPRAIRTIEDAPFLTRAQKRDILYNNAARFLRLPEATIRRQHGEHAAR